MTCALTPLALRVVGLRRLALAAFATGLVAAATQWLEPGTFATIAVAPYAAVCAIAGIVGIRNVLAKPWPPTAAAPAAGLIVLAGACVWLVAYRANISLLGYPPLWVLLTAAHFHIAGCYLPIVVGTVLRGRAADVVAVGCIGGLPLTAIGILVTGPIETVAAMVMATSAFAAGVLLLLRGRGLVRWAGAPLVVGMVLAMLYALREFGTAPRLGTLDPLSTMIVSHAILDTVFAALALVALVAIASNEDGEGPADRRPGR